MTYNQFHVVPARIWNTAEGYFFSRMRLLREIENKDMQQLRQAPPDNQNK
jgi:hypothetical protein